MDEVIISVCTITYNHAKYISQAIESVLSQVCTFKFEMIISDDCSTDGTQDIITEYAAKYPDIIKPILNQKNIGIQANNLQCLLACKGKYIAGLEGDDYWIDTHKLQKQADFMESNPEYSICFTAAHIIDELGMEIPDQFPEIDENTLDITFLIRSPVSVMPTAGLFFRNIIKDPMPAFFVNAISQDIALQLILANFGKIKYFPEQMVVYRHHAGGVTKTRGHIENQHKKLMQLFIEANEHFTYKYNTIIRDRLLKMAKTHLIYGSKNLKGIDKFRYYRENISDYYKYSEKINIKEVIYYHMILFFPNILKHLGRKNRQSIDEE